MLLAVSNRMNSFLQFFTVLLIFLFVLFITWAATRWIANFQQGRADGANIEVVETYRLTANKYVQIIRTGEKYLASMPDFKKIFEKAKRMDKNQEHEE